MVTRSGGAKSAVMCKSRIKGSARSYKFMKVPYILLEMQEKSIGGAEDVLTFTDN